MAARKAKPASQPLDWRGERIEEIRRLILEADPEIVEECK